MQSLIEVLTKNLEHIGMGMALFVVAYLSNMAFSIFYNVKILDMRFDWDRIWNSIIKIVGFGIGTTLLCVGVTCVPVFADCVGFPIPEQYQVVFQNLAILSVFIIAACKYLVESYDKFKKILDVEISGENKNENLEHAEDFIENVIE